MSTAIVNSIAHDIRTAFEEDRRNACFESLDIRLATDTDLQSAVVLTGDVSYDTRHYRFCVATELDMSEDHDFEQIARDLCSDLLDEIAGDGSETHPVGLRCDFDPSQKLCSFRVPHAYSKALITVTLWYLGVLPSGRQAIAYKVRFAGKTIAQGCDMQAPSHANCDSKKEQRRIAASACLMAANGLDGHGYSALLWETSDRLQPHLG